MSPQLDSFDDVQCEEIHIWDLIDTPSDPAWDRFPGPCYMTHDRFGPLQIQFGLDDIEFASKLLECREYGLRRSGGLYDTLLDLLLSGF